MMNLYHLYFSRPERNQKAILWSLFFFNENINALPNPSLSFRMSQSGLFT